MIVTGPRPFQAFQSRAGPKFPASAVNTTGEGLSIDAALDPLLTSDPHIRIGITPPSAVLVSAYCEQLLFVVD